MNGYYKYLDEAEDDLYINGTQGTYTWWIFHEENTSFHGTYLAVNSTNKNLWGNDGMIFYEEDEESKILNMLNNIQGGTCINIKGTDTIGSHQALEREKNLIGCWGKQNATCIRVAKKLIDCLLLWSCFI